jgi:putative transposase
MTKLSSFRHFRASPEIIRFAVMLTIPLSLRNVEDLPHVWVIELN